MCREAYERGPGRREYRNGYYERDFVTRFGTLRLPIARRRLRAFLRSQGESECAWEGFLRDLYRNVHSVDRILYAIFNRYNPQWKNRTLQLFTH